MSAGHGGWKWRGGRARAVSEAARTRVVSVDGGNQTKMASISLIGTARAKAASEGRTASWETDSTPRQSQQRAARVVGQFSRSVEDRKAQPRAPEEFPVSPSYLRWPDALSDNRPRLQHR